MVRRLIEVLPIGQGKGSETVKGSIFTRLKDVSDNGVTVEHGKTVPFLHLIHTEPFIDHN